ncbi:MAG: hypothetical protein K2X41_12405 [Hyphomicrobium sp.]|nr:hypothetical protein [Hyphomicrobium sp.]
MSEYHEILREKAAVTNGRRAKFAQGETTRRPVELADHNRTSALQFIDDVAPLTEEQLRMLPVAHQYSS